GLRAAGSSAALRAVSPNERAIFSDHTIETEVARLVVAAAELLGLPDRVEATDVDVTSEFVGERYGALTPAAVSAMKLFARLQAIILDPVYSAKAAAALVHDLE